MSRFKRSDLYQKVRELRCRTAEVYQSTNQNLYDFIALTKTWLHDGIHSAEMFHSDYWAHRKDRNQVVTGKRGKGVTQLGEWLHIGNTGHRL